MQKKEPFIINRLKSFGYAFKGLFYLIKTEGSIQIQLFIAIVITIAGFYFEISKTEWIAQVAMIGLVLGIESLNTAIEYIADFIHPEHHDKIGRIKDISAAAALIASLVAAIVGTIIYLPKLF